QKADCTERWLRFTSREVAHYYFAPNTSVSAMDEELLSGRRAYPVLPFCTDISQVEGELMIGIEPGHLCDMAAWKRLRKSVDQAASKSRDTCESCGKPGKFREIHWRHVYCDECIHPFAFDSPS
ncbi:hypothetical protein DIE18_33960, partial [Burkholderia sp. Bp9125]